MVEINGQETLIRIIDLGKAMFIGEAPYPDITEKIISERCIQLDPELANGGRCSSKTDFYSFGHMLIQ